MLTHSPTPAGRGSHEPIAITDLRVAILSDAAPERNGVGAYYRDLADHLRAHGARVSLVAPRYRYGRWHGGLRLPLPGDPTQRILVPSWSLIDKRLKRLRPNVIVVPTPGPYGMLGMHLAGRLGVHLVVGFHTHFEALTDLFQDWGWRSRIANAYLRGSHRLLFRNSQVVLANSTEMVEVARSIGAKRATLMATPIAKRFLDLPPSPSRPEIERVLFAGRLAPEKNLEAVVEAARRLPDAVSSAGTSCRAESSVSATTSSWPMHCSGCANWIRPSASTPSKAPVRRPESSTNVTCSIGWHCFQGITRAPSMDNIDSIRALVSIHDLMPETLESVQGLLEQLTDARISAVTLLVVPGAGWTPTTIDILHDFERRGYELAGHGWRHRVRHISGLRHRMHAALISRQVAEHMALDANGILELMQRCHAWFAEQGLRAPTLYVPPAWAMGRIERNALADLPFLQYELFSGILSAQTGRLHPMPLLGYEADTGVRAPILRLWNQVNRHRAKSVGWIRIGIHPHDMRLKLAQDLEQDLQRFPIHADYSAVDAEGDQRYRLVTSARSPCAADSTISNTRSKPL